MFHVIGIVGEVVHCAFGWQRGQHVEWYGSGCEDLTGAGKFRANSILQQYRQRTEGKEERGLTWT